MSEGSAGRWLLVAAGIVVVATIAAGIAVMGGPSQQRDRRIDERRVRDLDRIVDAVGKYVEDRGSLPPTLDALAGQPGRRLSIADPVDGAPYAYRIVGDRAFRLCADFVTDTSTTPDMAEPGPGDRDEWLHGAGRQCFERTVREKAASR